MDAIDTTDLDGHSQDYRDMAETVVDRQIFAEIDADGPAESN